MKTVNHEELKTLIKTAFSKKIALFIWGTTGIGKSQTVRTVAQQLAKDQKLEFSEKDLEDGKFGFVDVRISQLEPSDLRGLPKLDGETTKWIPPNWLPQNPNSKGILFFDELNLAPPSIQASAYQLILDRRLGDYKLPKEWVIISAGNRIEDRANIFELPAPLSNRFIHIELGVPAIQAWSKWGTENNNNIDSRIITFLNFKPTLLFKFSREQKDKAFPTPRSWEFCSKLISDIESNKQKELEILTSSAIGEGSSIEFCAFLKLSRKININEILSKPEKVKAITEIDLKYSLLSGLTEIYKKDKKHLDKQLKVCNFLEPEFAILLLRFLKAVKPDYFIKKVVTLKEWKELSSRYSKYLL